jgi:hypothetical protein
VIRIYDPTNETWIGDLSVDAEAGFTWGPTDATAPDSLNQINTCKVEVPAGHPLVDDLVFPNVVRFYDDPDADPFNAAVIEAVGKVEVSAPGDDPTVEVSGRTLESVLDRALVRGWVTDPEVEPQADARVHNHASPAFDTSTMPGAWYEQSRATSVPTRPLAWPDDYTRGVWPLPEAPGHPVGYVHGVHDFWLDIPEPRQVVFFYSGDDEVAIWCDGVRLAAEEPTHPSDVWHHTHKVAVLLPPGLHRFAIDGYNYAASGPGALWASAWKTDGTTLGEPIFIMGVNEANPWIGDWKVLAYPTAEPGMTAGKILRHMIQDAQSDGWCPTFACDFDDVENSNGDPWPIIRGYRPLLDQSIWQATERLREFHIDMRMNPGAGLTLQAYTKNPGVGGPSGASIDPGPGGELEWMKRVTRGLV